MLAGNEALVNNPLLRESGSSPEHGISLIRQRDVAWKVSIENSRVKQSDHSWNWDPLRLVAGLYQSVRCRNTSRFFAGVQKSVNCAVSKNRLWVKPHL